MGIRRPPMKTDLGPAAQRLPRGYERLVHLWTLRLLVRVGGHRNLLKENYCDDDRTLEVLGIQGAKRNYDRERVLDELFLRADRAERAEIRTPRMGPLSRNLDWLAKRLGLDSAEVEVLRFAILLDQHPILHNAALSLGHLNLYALVDSLAKTLNLDSAEVSKALSDGGTLLETGLLTIRESGSERLPEKLHLIKGLADPMMLSQKDPLQIFKRLFTQGARPKLSEEDFPHLNGLIRMLRAYLGAGVRDGKPGINILLHGDPGTGKTEFVRMLASLLGLPLFEIATERERGIPLESEARIRAFHLAQSFFRRTGGALLLLDEAEDVFSPDETQGHTKGIKGWIHKTLEENPLPSFWITNDLASMDPAHVRRFDVVQEFRIPPRSTRERILQKYLGGLDVEASLHRAIADHTRIPPAWVERAAHVIQSAIEEDPSLSAGECLTGLLTERLSGGKHSGLHVPLQSEGPEFRLECLHADCNLEQVLEGLERSGVGRFCLFGPPGTGKSAFGRHLAKILDRPLLVRKASDLLSKFLGEAERNMALMFEEARDTRSLLLLDEADSFLRDRTMAARSWEVTQVNEMLTQMETFPGVFIASTNLMDDLDPASMRRFDLKIKFDFLHPQQAWRLFLDLMETLRLPASEELRGELDRVKNLTPGDFAMLRNQAQILPVQSPGEAIRRLRDEGQRKNLGNHRPIGFLGCSISSGRGVSPA